MAGKNGFIPLSVANYLKGTLCRWLASSPFGLMANIALVDFFYTKQVEVAKLMTEVANPSNQILAIDEMNVTK